MMFMGGNCFKFHEVPTSFLSYRKLYVEDSKLAILKNIESQTKNSWCLQLNPTIQKKTVV